MATSSLQAAAISSQARRSRSLDALSALSQHASRFARKLSDMLPLQNHSTYSLAVPNRYKSAPLSTSLCNETLKMEGAYGHLGCHAKSAFAFIAKQSNICCKRVAENKGFLDTHIRFLARQSYGPALVDATTTLSDLLRRRKSRCTSRVGLYRRLLMGPCCRDEAIYVG
jgi:hypothetical protein